MWVISEIGTDWNAKGNFISRHKTKENAEKRIVKEIRKRVKNTHYVRVNEINDKCVVYDYGLWGIFLKLEEI